MNSRLPNRIAAGLWVIFMLSGCSVCERQSAPRPSVMPVSQDSNDTKTGKTSANFERFLDDLKKSFTPQQLRAVADRFFQAHPGFIGFIDRKQWTEVFKFSTAETNLPSFVLVSNPLEGKKTMMISYSGDSWMGGLNIGSVDEGEMRVDMLGLESHYSKWGEGVYVFFMSNETAGQGGHSDKRDPELGDLRTFLEVVKKAYTPQELREAADGYFQAHPDFNGFVAGKDWPEVFKLKKEMIGRPTFVS